MLTYLFSQVMAFLFGWRTTFTPYEGHDTTYSTGRVFVRLQWTLYTRWGGLFRFYQRKLGLPIVSLAFNPGIPNFMFQATCVSDELDFEDELPEGVIFRQWRCVTVVRSAGDLMELYNWLDETKATLVGDEDDIDAPFTADEAELTAGTLGTLTERFSECQLNS
jgi:hypothetical protein